MSTDFDAFFTYDDDIRRANDLINQMKFEEAEKLLDTYRGIFSGDIDFLYASANLLQKKNRYAEAEVEWRRFVEQFPDHVKGLANHAICLSGIGRRQEGLNLLMQGRGRFPQDTYLPETYLLLGLGERAPAATIADLRAECDGRGERHNMERAIERVRAKMLSLFEPTEIIAADPTNLLGLTSADNGAGGYKLKTIYERFEPLGSNCEFGFVQRDRGAEPLALFRWTSVNDDNLCHLLENKLEGYEAPENYSLSGNHAQEFLLDESRYSTRSHTGVNLSDVSAEELLTRLVRRQAFLKRKFIEEAAKGEKIFLYKSVGITSPEVIGRIEAALAALGVRRILIVQTRADISDISILAQSPRLIVVETSSHINALKLDQWDRLVVTAFDYFNSQPGS